MEAGGPYPQALYQMQIEPKSQLQGLTCIWFSHDPLSDRTDDSDPKCKEQMDSLNKVTHTSVFPASEEPY